MNATGVSTRHAQVLIIGGGPGGYVAGIRAGQLGLDAIVVDPQPLGGTCLNVGCIPSKALIHVADEFNTATGNVGGGPLGISVTDPSIDMAAAVSWKNGIVRRLNNGVGGLLTKAGTEVIPGRAALVDGKTADITAADGSSQRITADHVVIATGSEPTALPNIPFDPAGAIPVISSTEALSLAEVPKRLAVVGGGYIGLELGTALAKLGSQVTIVEAEPRILPLYDRALTRPVAKSLKDLGVEVLLSTKAASVDNNGLTVDGENGQQVIEADLVLVTIGRRPTLSGAGLERLGLSMNGPFIAVDDQCRTSMRNVWAIGDVTGEPMLAHRAMKQGEVVAEVIAGQHSAFDPTAIPAIVFTDPEIVTVGLGPDEAADAGLDVIIGRFPLSANGRSMTLEADAGFVRAVARADDHLIVGLQAVGRGVAELSTAFGLALEMGTVLEDIAGTIHAHPTVGEGLAESALAALGHALHI